MAVSHAIVEGSERFLLPGAVAVGRAEPKVEIEVSLKLRRKKTLPELTRRPTSSMTRKQLAAKHGASTSDIAKVVKILGQFGLKSITQDPATRTIRFRGTIADMEEAFQVKLFNYTHDGEGYRGRVGHVHVPISLKNIVEAVFGLDNRRMVRRRRQPVSRDLEARSGSIPTAWYTPQELASHYHFPPGDGGGQTIGLLEFGGGYFPDDLKQFCILAKVPASPTVVTISSDGTPTNARDGAEGEVMLDIEVAAGVCPKAKIAVYFAHFSEQGWVTALDAAVHDQKNDPGVISVSWGYAEGNLTWTKQAMTQINETLKEAAVLGVTVCIASGDDGSSDAIGDGYAHIDFPASSPYVLAVGGTTIPVKGSNKSDITWKEGDGLRADNGGSTGGGVSAFFLRPAWQKNIKITSVNPGHVLGRCIPDIAANADWNASPYLLVVDGKAGPNGGTSAATPLVASLLTLINAKRTANKRVGYVTPALYLKTAGGKTIGAASCTDVSSGDNTTDRIGGYRAAIGYDAVSGWGTPNGQKLAQLLP
jgi:kumamolisin